MKCQRKGTNQRIANNLRIHSLIYSALIEFDGMEPKAADELAFKHVVAKDQAYLDAAHCLGIDVKPTRNGR